MLKEYSDKMVMTVAQCLFSTVQSFVVAVVAERDFSQWKLRFDVTLLAVLYSASPPVLKARCLIILYCTLALALSFLHAFDHYFLIIEFNGAY